MTVKATFNEDECAHVYAHDGHAHKVEKKTKTMKLFDSSMQGEVGVDIIGNSNWLRQL